MYVQSTEYDQANSTSMLQIAKREYYWEIVIYN